MKRQLSLVLALVMILGTFTSVFADTTVDADAAKVASEFLKKQGVLVGDTTGDLGLGKNLLRQDTVVLVSKLMGAFDEAKAFEEEGKPTYEDVRDPFYLPLLAWAQANETFVGHSDAKFGFGENLTAQEYAKVLLVALEYTVGPEGDKDVAWKDALVKATELGLLKDVEAENATEILRSQMAVMTFNALGAKVKGGDKTLAEKLGIEMPKAPEADKLEVKSVYTENLAEVVVELSNAKLADKAKLENPANYRLKGDNDPVVKSAKVDGNNVVLTLVPVGKVADMTSSDLSKSLVKDSKYELTMRNIAREINSTVKDVVAKDNAIPTIVSVDFMGDYGIKVVTSEPVRSPQERNFVIDGTRTSMIIEQYGREIILTPYHDKAFAKDAKELVVKGLEDFAAYKSVEADYDLELSTDKDAPKVVKALRNGNKLTVHFDRDIYEKSVKGYESRRDLGNVSFQERRVTFYAEIDGAKKIAPNVAVYTFETEIPKNAEVTVEGVQNHFKVAMEAQVVNPDLFVDEFAPVIISKLVNDVESTNVQVKGAETNATKNLKITFDKDIQEFVDHIAFLKDKTKGKELKVEDFFTVYELNVSNKGKDAAKEVKVKIAKDGIKADQIELTFEKIKVNNRDRDFDYVLEVRDLSDLNRNRMEREYIDFQIVKATEDFQLKSVEVKDVGAYRTEVKLSFNKSVNKAIAEDKTNYFFGPKKEMKASEAIVERDGKTVTLLVREDIAKVKGYNVLEVSPRVIDVDDNKIVPKANVSSRFWNLVNEKIVNVEDVSVSSAITYINGGLLTTKANADKKIVAVTADTELLTVTAESEYTIWVKDTSVAGAETWKKEASPLKISKLVGITLGDLDKAAKEVEVQVRDKDGKVVETVKFYTEDITAPKITKAEATSNVQPVAATKTFTNLTVTAVTAGKAGDDIKFAITENTDDAVTATVEGTVVTVTGKTADLTLENIKKAVEANAEAKALIVVSYDEAKKAEKLATTAETALANGADMTDATIALTIDPAADDMDKTIKAVKVTVAGKAYDAKVTYDSNVKITLTIEGKNIEEGVTIKAGDVFAVEGLKDVNGNAVVFLVGGLQ